MSQKVCTQLKEHMIELADDLKSIFTLPADTTDLNMLKIGLTVLNEVELMNSVVENFLPYKKQIIDRNLSFFKEHKNQIFKGLDQKRVDYFDDRITKPVSQGGISDDDKEAIWQYFDVIIQLSEEYKKNC
jgi:hypothetical protein